MSIEHIIFLSILTMIFLVGASVAYIKDLFLIALVNGVFSILSAIYYVYIGALDVALTESSVGVGVSTLLSLTVLSSTKYSHLEKKNKATPFFINKKVIFFTMLLVFLITLYLLLDIPNFGDINNPANNEIYNTYVKDSYNVYGVPNIVTMVLASFRGYDTLGETIVIFLASIGVYALLKDFSFNVHTKNVSLLNKPLDGDNIIRITSWIFIPVITLFAAYIQLHGEISPGGGFQAGVIFAVSYMLCLLIFGIKTVDKIIYPKALRVMMASTLFSYILLGFITMIFNGNFLEYNIFNVFGINGQIFGIFFIELAVGSCVFASICLIFNSFYKFDG